MSDRSGQLLRGERRWTYGDPPVGNANYAWVQSTDIARAVFCSIFGATTGAILDGLPLENFGSAGNLRLTRIEKRDVSAGADVAS